MQLLRLEPDGTIEPHMEIPSPHGGMPKQCLPNGPKCGIYARKTGQP